MPCHATPLPEVKTISSAESCELNASIQTTASGLTCSQLSAAAVPGEALAARPHGLEGADMAPMDPCLLAVVCPVLYQADRYVLSVRI